MSRQRFFDTRRAGVLLCLVLAAACNRLSTDGTDPITEISEGGLREFANTVVLPDFPVEAARNAMAGVAIARVTVDKQGRPSDVEVVDSPSAAIGDAVRRAVWKWVFSELRTNQQPVRYRATLTFYFISDGTHGTVFHPDDAPYIGRWN